MSMQFILASQSPRRKELLQQLGYEFSIQAADIDETPQVGELGPAYVQRLAQEKAAKIFSGDLPVLAADTIVFAQGQILEKPADEEDAWRMLSLLSDGEHEVLTAVALQGPGFQKHILRRTQVSFAPISRAEVRAYWASGEPQGKAGAYAIQGLAGSFVRDLRGSYTGVVGLPLHETAALLKLLNIYPPALRP